MAKGGGRIWKRNTSALIGLWRKSRRRRGFRRAQPISREISRGGGGDPRGAAIRQFPGNLTW